MLAGGQGGDGGRRGVAAGAEGSGGDDRAAGEERDAGEAGADVGDHPPGRVVDGQACAECGGQFLVDERHPPGGRPVGQVAQRVALHRRGVGGHRHDEPWPCERVAVHLRHDVRDQPHGVVTVLRRRAGRVFRSTGDRGGFVVDDAAAGDVDLRGGRAEVEREVAAEERERVHRRRSGG